MNTNVEKKSMERDLNFEKLGLTESQIEGLERSEALLGKATQSQLDLMTDQAMVDKERLSKQMESIGESISDTESKIGFAYSGDINVRKSDITSEVRKSEESLMANYGAKVGKT